jgi:hypothetical protein
VGGVMFVLKERARVSFVRRIVCKSLVLNERIGMGAWERGFR